MIPMQILTDTAGVTASLAMATPFLTLAAILCGAVLVGLGYEARRGNGTPTSRPGGTEHSPGSPLGFRAPERFFRAA